MKTLFFYFSLAAVLVGLVGCSPKHNRTIPNLQAAIDGEMTASAQYAAYAQQAAQDGLLAVEALFKATSQAESIHAYNHRKVLEKLGVKGYQPEIAVFEVKTTAGNLKSAIDGETYEFAEMYPVFILDAETEKVQDAVISFNYAQDAEKKHAKIYAQVAALLTTPDAIAQVYYVCPKCGNVYSGTSESACELCGIPVAAFMTFEVPVATPSSETAVD